MNSYNNTCPSCGRDKLSITIREDGTRLFNCFRSSCNYRGASSPTGVVAPTIRPNHKIGNPYGGVLDPPPANVLSLLNDEVGFTPQHVTISRPCYSYPMKRVAFPLLSPSGSRQGYCLRSYTGAEPKALTYLNDNSSKLSYYHRFPDSTSALLVEDIPSAVRAAIYMNSVALLGTSIPEYELHELAEQYSTVIIALDKDATADAIRLQRSMSLLFREVNVLMLPCDIKDLTEEEVCDLLTPLQE